MKVLKIYGLTGVVAALVLFLAAKSWIAYRQPVLVGDITFDVSARGQDMSLKLWHNYYDGKEYLFLPSVCSGDVTFQIRQKNRSRGIWDGNAMDGETVFYGLEAGSYLFETGDQKFTVEVMKSSVVPALFLTTNSGSLEFIEKEKGNGEAGMFRMISEDGEAFWEGGVAQLRSRGNITFQEDKKPYQLTLETPADLIGAGEARKYILLANRQDQSMLRDRIVYDLAGMSGLAYSPASRFVDLYINNEYRGTYQLSEKVEVGTNRVEIRSEEKDREPGFLLELEYAQRVVEEENYFLTKNGQSVLIKYPKKPSDAQSEYIREYFQEVEDAVREGRIGESSIDVTSFARKYLIEEVSKNLDAMYSSQYFYKDSSSLDPTIYAGPVWDYDKSLGNPVIENTRPVNFQDPRGIYAASWQEMGTWWHDLYQQPYFYEKMKEEYKETVLPQVQKMIDAQIDGYAEEIWASANMDYMRWDTFEDFKNGEELEFEEEYAAEIQWIKQFLSERTGFLNDVWLEGRIYNRITCDPAGGDMPVAYIEGVEGRTLSEPRDPKMEGYRFKQWVRQDTGEVYDFSQLYDGKPFTLVAEYEKKNK